MQRPDDLGKSLESKLLAFPSAARSAQSARSDADRAAESDGSLSLRRNQFDFEDLPHDIASLRRPTPADVVPSPRLAEADGLAHDARNLLTSLELFAGLLGEPGVLADEHKHFAKDLQSLAIPLTVLVERMANASRTGDAFHLKPGADRAPEPAFAREPIRPGLRTSRGAAAAAARVEREFDPEKDIGALVKSSERLLGAIAGPAVALHISYERGLGEPALGAEDLTRVLINLVKNAGEAMPRGGRIVITVRKGLGAQPSALLSVEDTGAGIPAHALGQIFQPGFSSKKVPKRWPAANHHGLGLTIVRDLVEGAGGSVRVRSTLKKGTTFELKIPCYRS